MKIQPIEAFMTKSPQCIQANATVIDAWRLMKSSGTRHLPVLDGDKLVGIVSERGLYRLETVANIDRAGDPVRDAMTAAYSVERGAPLDEVVEEMARCKVGAAIVLDGPRVIGIFTTTDALQALAAVLSPPAETFAAC